MSSQSLLCSSSHYFVPFSFTLLEIKIRNYTQLLHFAVYAVHQQDQCKTSVQKAARKKMMKLTPDVVPCHPHRPPSKLFSVHFFLSFFRGTYLSFYSRRLRFRKITYNQYQIIYFRLFPLNIQSSPVLPSANSHNCLK